MSSKILHKIVVREGTCQTTIVGIVDNREVILLYDTKTRGWMVGSSVCLPTYIKKAEELLRCYTDAFQKMHELISLKKLNQSNNE